MRSLFVSAVLLAAALGPAQEAKTNRTDKSDKPDATQLLDTAKIRALKEGKAVFVLFQASWCKWCDRLAKEMEKPDFKAVMDQHFVAVSMTIYERGPKMKEETPGAYEVLDWLGGRKSGIPFYAVLSAEGKVLGTSMRPVPESSAMLNTGFPSATEEISHFIGMLRKGAPLATEAQLEAIRAQLSAPPETPVAKP